MLGSDSHKSGLSKTPANISVGLWLKTGLASREEYCRPLFSLGALLTRTFLGEDSGFRRRMGLSHDPRNGTLTLWRSVEEGLLRNRLARSGIRACSERFFLATIPGIQVWADFLPYCLSLLGAGSERLPASSMVWIRRSCVL